MDQLASLMYEIGKLQGRIDLLESQKRRDLAEIEATKAQAFELVAKAYEIRRNSGSLHAHSIN